MGSAIPTTVDIVRFAILQLHKKSKTTVPY